MYLTGHEDVMYIKYVCNYNRSRNVCTKDELLPRCFEEVVYVISVSYVQRDPQKTQM